jgi:hypothetical protein
LSFGNARLIDSGASTSCENPGFDNRTPAVYSEYEYSGAATDAIAWLETGISDGGWSLIGKEPTAAGKVLIANFVKPFGDWRAKLLLSVRETSYQIVLQASDRSDCSE